MSTESEYALLSAITAANRRVMDSFAQGQFVELANCYTADARVLVANIEPIVGRASIAAVFTHMRKRIYSLELKTHLVQGEAGIAIESGGYVHKSEDGTVLDRGKYLVAWNRVQDQWLISQDMIVSDVPLSERAR